MVTLSSYCVIVQTGGDILNNDGSGSLSIYGDVFPDENLNVNGTKPGFVGMANSGKYSYFQIRIFYIR